MRQYELKERKEISKIICNKCGKEIPVSGGHEMKGVFRVDYEWGYFSEKTERDMPLICAKRAMMHFSNRF